MSSFLRTLSRNGTSRFKPGVSVRLYLPSRSTISIVCCGTTRTDRTSVMRTISPRPIAITKRTSSSGPISVPPHHGRGALDLHDAHALALGDHLGRVVGARPPQFTFDFHHAVIFVDLLDDQAGRTLDRVEPHRRVALAALEVLTQGR